MSITPQDPIEAYENRRHLDLQFLLAHLRDQRPDGGETETHAQPDRGEPPAAGALGHDDGSWLQWTPGPDQAVDRAASPAPAAA